MSAVFRNYNVLIVPLNEADLVKAVNTSGVVAVKTFFLRRQSKLVCLKLTCTVNMIAIVNNALK